MRHRPWALHEITLVGDTAKVHIIRTFQALKMIVRYSHSFNHRKYQVTKAWLDNEMENVRLYELASMVKRVKDVKT